VSLKVHRGRKISLRLLLCVFERFERRGMKQPAAYNHHLAFSHSLYRKFSATVLRQDRQMDGKMLVEAFTADMSMMKALLQESLGQA